MIENIKALEYGTTDSRELILMDLGIEDKFLQSILKKDPYFYKIVESIDIKKTIIELFGESSAEYFSFVL